jgi:putative ABC transport system permease protein
MNASLYRRLAAQSMHSNAQLYRPYRFACAGMVCMVYIVLFLTRSPLLAQMRSGSALQWMLEFGFEILSFFALLFLFYTHAFLIRRRKKEFGLYNILGMGKRHLARLLVWETLLTALQSLAIGLACGVAFSKLAELAMVKLFALQVDFSLRVDPASLAQTALVFAGIFLLLLVSDLAQIHLASPIQLLRSENAGEKPPRANWALALLGAVLLGTAYYMAVTITNPLDALYLFFVAVLLVIAATYLLFIAGAVALCRLLQRNRRFYYQTRHFISVSSLNFRLKRSGAGLASISILCTMVLVMISSSSCLYLGTEDTLNTRYPYDINITATDSSSLFLEESQLDALRADLYAALEAAGQSAQTVTLLDYRQARVSGMLNGDVLDLSQTLYDVSDAVTLYFVPLSDYNRATGSAETLADGEALLLTDVAFVGDQLTLQSVDTASSQAVWRIKQQLSVPRCMRAALSSTGTTCYLVVADLDAALTPLRILADFRGDQLVRYSWACCIDLASGTSNDTAIDIYTDVFHVLRLAKDAGDFSEFSCSSRADERDWFYTTYGSILFLGVLLSIVFVCAAVLIMYYKQLAEGYEDQSRFAIMQKVGLTRQDIRKSVNSQMLLVFFAPLAMAGLHLGFAFLMLRRMLLVFSLTNTQLLVEITLGCYAAFALLYVGAYRFTSQAYYRIVSAAQTAPLD